MQFNVAPMQRCDSRKQYGNAHNESWEISHRSNARNNWNKLTTIAEHLAVQNLGHFKTRERFHDCKNNHEVVPDATTTITGADCWRESIGLQKIH